MNQDFHNCLVIGGCRSGKSRQALKLAEAISGDRKYFIATCNPQDAEMVDRVERHKSERKPPWQTIEAPLNITTMIGDIRSKADVILVDCLTLWTSNILLNHPETEDLESWAAELESTLRMDGCPIIMVTNEVGTGIVPENRLARRFRDMAGFLNQRIAGVSDRVIWMVAGIPVKIK
jgi:adenosylcobinamide kinase/adenosylcobinamide-phosphate guanylyltransferase